MPLYGDNHQNSKMYVVSPGTSREQLLLMITKELRLPTSEVIKEVHCSVNILQAWCRLAVETITPGESNGKRIFEDVGAFKNSLRNYQATTKVEVAGRPAVVKDTEVGAVASALLAASIDGKVVLLINDDGTCECIEP